MIRKVCFAILTFTLVITDYARGDESNKAQPEWVPVNWDLLVFDEKRSVIKVKITLNKALVASEHFLPLDEDLHYETTDKRVLQAFQQFITHPSRIAIRNDQPVNYGGSTDFVIGLLEVTTNRDKFVISLNQSGFALGPNAHAQNGISTWALAQFVDDLVFAKSKRHISPFLFDSMSGESSIRTERELYFQMMEREK